MTDRVITFRDAINEAMRLEMRRDPSVILIGEDVAGGARLPHIEGAGTEAWGGVMGVSHGLVQEFGRERVLDTPISESAFIGAAMTAAATGLCLHSAPSSVTFSAGYGSGRRADRL
jgi:pyruvate dehydrogenase E1 component beta subunit